MPKSGKSPVAIVQLDEWKSQLRERTGSRNPSKPSACELSCNLDFSIVTKLQKENLNNAISQSGLGGYCTFYWVFSLRTLTRWRWKLSVLAAAVPAFRRAASSAGMIVRRNIRSLWESQQTCKWMCVMAGPCKRT